jgi:hypothetical protein
MTDPSSQRRLLRNTYTELTVCAVVWLVTLLWTISYNVLAGYKHAPDSWLVTAGWARHPDAKLVTVFGFPDWVFWGIVVPWVIATAFTVVYSLWGMADDDLGHEADQKTGLVVEEQALDKHPAQPTRQTEERDAVTRKDTSVEEPRHDV